MLIVKFQGGLGNQMFQYAFYIFLKRYCSDVKADLSVYTCGIDKRDFELEKVFGILPQIATKEDIISIVGREDSKINRIIHRWKTHQRRITEKNFKLHQIKPGSKYWFDGYWQGEKWFSEVERQIREEFVFKEDSSRKNIVDKIQECESVSIHVRFGDYLQNQDLYGKICTKDYYEKAIQFIKKNVDMPVFFVFSDELDKAQELLGQSEDMIYVEKEDNNAMDMRLMSMCKHNIIANSSFSWWSAWLNSNKEKIVVTPAKWNNIDDIEEIYCEGWVRI